ncbi:calcium-dependent kinase-like [Raphidocelis subcapitata]|uniref:Calcium-dependent kinase-like n=1 Tax=Raphidocelis subcapitata TaxID=307507 RepID=A0A2V0PD00_9CHLO|nr:calcium-dependent kinase-like [Raphidocelis subcapitata]|eukprot:GBF96832.1 calcium-dependent kinase-like [Raphidocelis subcapitata]
MLPAPSRPRPAAAGPRRPSTGTLRPPGSSTARAVRPRALGGSVAPGASAAPQDAAAKGPLIKEFGFRSGFGDHYQLGPLLGSGSFATVHVAVDRSTGERFAVKTLTKRFLGEYLEPLFAARVRHEVDVYRAMGQSLNVAHLEAAFEDDVAADLVLELCEGGTMWQRIRRGAYSEAAAARIVREVLRAVAQCHAKGVILRDVKPDNFLFLNDREDSPLKMVDFGLAQFCSPGDVLHDRAGTPFFVAPEVLKQSYSLPADVWSAGITAYQLLTGRFPWHNDPDIMEAQQAADADDAGRTGRAGGGMTRMTNKTLFRAIISSEFDYSWDPWPAHSPEAKDFVQSMLQRDPEQRPTAAQLLRHPWLARLDAPSAADGGGGGGGLEGAPLSDTLVQRLQRYGTYGRLKQIALREVASLMLQDGTTLQGLADAFSRLDPGGSGRVPFEVAAAELRDGGYDLSESEIRTLLLQFDLDRDGTIDLAEWVSALMDWAKVEKRQEWESWVHKVFDQFDADGSSRISNEELARVLCAASGDEELCIPDAVPAALRRVDADGDGYVSFEEFLAMLHTSEAEALELFPSRRIARGGRRTATPRGGSPAGGGGARAGGA